MAATLRRKLGQDMRKRSVKQWRMGMVLFLERRIGVMASEATMFFCGLMHERGISPQKGGICPLLKMEKRGISPLPKMERGHLSTNGGIA